MQNKRVAIVYDWLYTWGGVERILLLLGRMFPQAHFYTAYYEREGARWALEFPVCTSFIQRIPRFIRHHKAFTVPLYSLAFERFDLSSYDVVISVTSAFAKSVLTKPSTLHMSYILTPPRYVWGMVSAYLHPRIHPLVSPVLSSLRTVDYVSAQRPDYMVALSDHVAQRCKTYYKRDVSVLYPPFDSTYWENMHMVDRPTLSIQFPQLPPDVRFYLMVSRLEPYKKVDIAIEAFRTIKDRYLVIIGTGSRESILRAQASSNVLFLRNLSDETMASFYSHAEALLMPQEEDFGYVALEAQCLQTGVLAYAHGGACETVLENKTGLFFSEQTAGSLVSCIERWEEMAYNNILQDPTERARYLDRFSYRRFHDGILAILSGY